MAALDRLTHWLRMNIATEPETLSSQQLQMQLHLTMTDLKPGCTLLAPACMDFLKPAHLWLKQ